MSITTEEEFLSSFQSLDGITVGERRRNLFLLLNQIKQSDVVVDLSSIQPITPLEEVFKVEALIYFRRVSELAQFLKCKNPILIHRIIKNDWFLKEAFQTITGDQLVTLVFPYISFRTKEKILNKLSLYISNPQQADDYYLAVEKKYGIYLAAKLLPSCSFNLIMNLIKSNRIFVTSRQLQTIVMKYPEHIEHIIKTVNGRVNIKDYKKVFLFLAKYNVLLFLKFYEEYNLSFNLGRRVTKRIIQARKQNIVSSPNTYYVFLHKKQISKSLKNDFKDFYFNLFPKTVEQFKNSYDLILSVLQEVPVKSRDVNLLASIFEALYNTQLWDHPAFVTISLLKMLAPNEREKRMKIEYKPSTVSEDEWNSYQKTENSIPYLKKRILLSSDIKTRADLMELLVKTCKINEDRVALANICKYMMMKHRNDHITVRLAFIKTLKKNFKLENLDEEHWISINELIQVFTVNDEPFYHGEEFLEGYIHYRLMKGLPVKEQLNKWLTLRYNELNIIKEKAQYEKQCLLMFGEIIPEIFKEDDYNSWNGKYFCALINWNKRHPKDEISMHDSDILKVYKKSLGDKHRYLEPEIINYFLKMKDNIEEKTEFLSIFLSDADRYIDMEIMNWLIKNDPLFVQHNVDSITQAILKTFNKKSSSFFWKYCRNYFHLQIPSKVINICVNILQKDGETSKYESVPRNAILAISYIMSADEFIKFIVPYYPVETRTDLKTDKGRKLFAVQQDIGACLRNIQPPSCILESILVFCKGDYLRLIQSSLYSVCGNTNEDRLLPFINELAKRSVSVRKHSLHLAFRVLDKQQIWNIINRFIETDTDVSIRKFIFKCAFNLFVKYPNDESWELIKLNINAVDVSDEEAVGILMQFNKVPLEYLDKYVPFIWEFLNKFPDPDHIETDKAILLASITSDLSQSLPKEFCLTIINGHLFKCNKFTYFQAVVQVFACKFIIYCTSQLEQEERLETVSNVLRQYVILTFHNPTLRQAGYSCVTNFIKEFCSEFLDKKHPCKDVLIRFVELWNSFVKPHECFGEYLHLQFTLIYVENLPIPLIGQKLAELLQSLEEVYGSVIVEGFYNKITFFSSYFLGDSNDHLEENRFILIENLIKSNNSVTCLLLVILLLNKNIPVTKKSKEIYINTLDFLERKHDPIITMYLHQHFKSIIN